MNSGAPAAKTNIARIMTKRTTRMLLAALEEAANKLDLKFFMGDSLIRLGMFNLLLYYEQE
jgi:hypothetical protein